MVPSTRRLTITLAFAVGSTVYLQCRPDRLPGIVVGFVRRQEATAYIVAWGDATESSHYGVELSARYDPDFDLRDDDDDLAGEGDDAAS